MTVEDCRKIIKVHIYAAEGCGRLSVALALTEVLDAIDSELKNPDRPENIYPNRPSAGVDAPKD